jgi:hypothetical protein
MRVAQGGTQMHCPYCGEVQVCRAISTTELGKRSGQRWYREDHEDIRWFRRGRECTACNNRFVTAEVDEDFLDELVELRNALANLKVNAEEYVKESTAASAALARLTSSLGLLRALNVYRESENWSARPIADLELSVRASNALESAGIANVGDLCKRTADELLQVRYFGETVLREVRDKLAKAGLRLRE